MSTASSAVSAPASDKSRTRVARHAGGLPPAPKPVPATVIEPPRGWQPLNLREVWAYRDLLFFLIWRDAKVQYKQTALGPVWAVLRPVMNMLVFSVLFGALAGIPSNGHPYPLFVYAGLLPWTFFSTALTSASMSLISNAHLVTKIYFPRVFLPAAGVGGALANFGVGFAVYWVMMAGYVLTGSVTPPGLSILLLPILVLLTSCCALGLGLLFAGLAVRYRDIRFVLPSLIQAGLYATPVIYPVAFIPERYRWLLLANPMTGIVEAFRGSLLNHPVNAEALALSAMLSVFFLVLGACVFRRAELHFADVG